MPEERRVSVGESMLRRLIDQAWQTQDGMTSARYAAARNTNSSLIRDLQEIARGLV